MKLIANLATLNDDGSIHLVYVWLLRIDNYICIPHFSPHKYRKLVSRPRASEMIDLSRAGLNLKGLLIKGQVELVVGEEAQKTNRLIPLKYVTPEMLDDLTAAFYLSKGNDVTVKVRVDYLISWNDSTQRRLVPSARWLDR
jgi:Pyridoxamine 5'-phosphate oxidase